MGGLKILPNLFARIFLGLGSQSIPLETPSAPARFQTTEWKHQRLSGDWKHQNPAKSGQKLLSAASFRRGNTMNRTIAALIDIPAPRLP
jgi:hypothetical protein